MGQHDLKLLGMILENIIQIVFFPDSKIRNI